MGALGTRDVGGGTLCCSSFRYAEDEATVVDGMQLPLMPEGADTPSGLAGRAEPYRIREYLK